MTKVRLNEADPELAQRWQLRPVSGEGADLEIRAADGRCLGIYQCETRWPWWLVVEPCRTEAASGARGSTSCSASAQHWVWTEDGRLRSRLQSTSCWGGAHGLKGTCCMDTEGSNVEVDECGWMLNASRQLFDYDNTTGLLRSRLTNQVCQATSPTSAVVGEGGGGGRDGTSSPWPPSTPSRY